MSHTVTDATAAGPEGREQPTGEPRAVLEAGPSKAPSVSVLMPTYNPGRYVSEAIESILRQTHSDFEFLISDAGSTDGSLEVMRRHADSDPRIRLIVRPKMGIPAALNEILGMARGDLIARMDADDVSLPERFERQVAYLNEHPECLLVGSRVLIIDSDGDEITVMGKALSHEEIVDAFLANQGQMIYHPAIMFRREAVMAIGGYDVKMIEAEDLDLFLRLADVGRIVNLPEPLLKYREHLQKTGRVRAERLEQYSRMILNEARKRRNMGSLPEPEPRLTDAKAQLETTVQTYQVWAWWALQSGRVTTARKYGWASLARAPLSPASWRVLYCALRGH